MEELYKNELQILKDFADKEQYVPLSKIMEVFQNPSEELLDDIVKYLRKFVLGYENCFITSSASLIGIRETRHFKGKYTLNEQDILEAKVFDDYVVKDAYFNFDVHNLTGSSLDKTGMQAKFPKNTKLYSLMTTKPGESM